MTALARTPPTLPGRDFPRYLQLAWSKDASQAQSPEAQQVLNEVKKVVRQWNQSNAARESNPAGLIADAVHALKETYNSARDRRIADRLESLSIDAESEDQAIRPSSVIQFREFFLENRQLGMPKITLTPDGTLSVRWITGPGHFFAIEFTGRGLAKLVAEIPRDGLTAKYFVSEPISSVTNFAQAIGASLA